MLWSSGIDKGTSSTREVSVNVLNGRADFTSQKRSFSSFVALPSSKLTFRRIFLPAASKAVRQQVISEELSYSLPFPLSDAHFGSVERGEEAWVVVAPESIVEPLQELYPKAQLEAEPLCYLRAARAAGIERALVVDLGASKTVFCGLDDGQIGQVRVLLRGGEALTDAIAEQAGCVRPEAEALKMEEGLEHRAVREFYSELLQEALLPSPLPYQRVLLCGGGSGTPGLLGFLSKAWGPDVDIEPFPLPSELSASDHVTAYGAALAGRPRSIRLAMDHDIRRSQTDGRPPLRFAPLVFGLLLLVLMTVSVETRLASLQEREGLLAESIRVAVEPVLQRKEALEPDQVVKTLRAQLEEQRAVASSSPGQVMNSLGRSANAVTNQDEALLYSVIFEERKLRLEGRAQSLAQSEEIRSGLEQVLLGVEQVRTRPSTGNSFIFQLEGQLPES